MMKKWLITKLGGYPDIDSVFEAILTNKEKDTILTLLVKDLFNTISADDILQEKNGEWLFENKPITEAEIKLICAEATQFLGMKLWKVLEKDIKYQANRRMFLLAENEIQMTAGKLWLYTIDCFRTRLESLSKRSGLFNIRQKPIPKG